MRRRATRISAWVAAWFVLAGAASAADEPAPSPLAEAVVQKLAGLPADALSDGVTIDADGHHIAWTCHWKPEQDKVVHLLRDGRPEPPLGWGGVQVWFSPDGKRMAYAATRGHPVLVVDGAVMPTRRDIRAFAFSPDSRRVAVIEAGVSVWFDATLVAKGDGFDRLVFSPDSKHAAWVEGPAALRDVMIDGRRGPFFRQVLGPVFMPSSKSFIYPAQAKVKWSVVGWTEDAGAWEEMGDVVLSTDGSRIAFRARSANRWAVVSGKPGPGFDEVSDPVFSLDGSRLAYRAREANAWYLVRDGKKGPGYVAVGNPVFSPDASHVAFTASADGKDLLVSDGREIPLDGPIDWFAFSPDSKHFAALARAGESMRMSLDGRLAPVHQQILVPSRWDTVPGKARYVAIDKNDASLVEVDWPKDRTWEDAFKPPPPPAK